MYIGINKFSAFAADHKPLHVFITQQEINYARILIDTISINLNLMFMYISQIYFNVTNKVARSRHMVVCQQPRKPCGTQFASVIYRNR